MSIEIAFDGQFGARIDKGVHRYLPDGINPSEFCVVRELTGERLDNYKNVDLLREAMNDLQQNYGIQTINFIPIAIYPENLPFTERENTKPERLFIFSEFIEGLGYPDMVQLMQKGDTLATESLANLTATMHRYYEDKLSEGGVTLTDMRLFQFIFMPQKNVSGEIVSFTPVFVDVDPFVQQREAGNTRHLFESLEDIGRFIRELNQLVYGNLHLKKDGNLDKLAMLLESFHNMMSNPRNYRTKRLVPA